MSGGSGLASIAAVLLVAAGSAGCDVAGIPAASSPPKVEPRSVQAQDARTAHVHVVMQPGNLRIRGGARPLLDARFTY